MDLMNDNRATIILIIAITFNCHCNVTRFYEIILVSCNLQRMKIAQNPTHLDTT